MNGDNYLTNEERVQQFLDRVDDFIKDAGVDLVEANPQVKEIMNMQYDDLKSLSNDECSRFAFLLYSYAEHINHLLNKQNTIKEWAEDSIWYIISKDIGNYGSQYSKWQEKYYGAVRENPLASEIQKVLTHAKARVNLLQNTANNISRLGDILLQQSKRY